MEGKYTYDYPRAALTTDCVVFGFDGEDLKILLITRGIEPYKGRWALPGGFMRIDETTDECARRELQEETGVWGVFMRQIQSFSSLGRDPRGRVVSVAYYALLNPSMFNSIVVAAGDDAADAKWFPLEDVLYADFLAFDHHEIIRIAIEKLRQEIRHYPIAFELLDELFTIKQLQTVYESILGTRFDRGNFHKKMVGISTNTLASIMESYEPAYNMKMPKMDIEPTFLMSNQAPYKKMRKEQKKNIGVLIDTGEVVKGAKHKPAKIYRFDRSRFEELVGRADFTFDF